jgi:hypothetical protein
MTHDFTGKAIFCTTWQQMLHLADLAREQGLNPYWFGQGDHTFENGFCYFMLCSGNLIPPNHFSSYKEWDVEDKLVVTYADFITPTTFINPPVDDSVYGC